MAKCSCYDQTGVDEVIENIIEMALCDNRPDWRQPRRIDTLPSPDHRHQTAEHLVENHGETNSTRLAAAHCEYSRPIRPLPRNRPQPGAAPLESALVLLPPTYPVTAIQFFLSIAPLRDIRFEATQKHSISTS